MEPAGSETLRERLIRAFAFRSRHFDDAHESACRLFNGFTEGEPDLAIDLYARTVVIHDYGSAERDAGGTLVAVATETVRSQLPWVRSIVHKARSGKSPAERNGVVLFGDEVDTCVRENGVLYAVAPRINRDAGLYLDTRELRAWAVRSLRGRSVLNTFAYTCSLGVAATAAGASRVVNTDRNPRFLDVGRQSYALNRFAVARNSFVAGDFFPTMARFKRARERFDAVFLDPPFFATTTGGTVDLEGDVARLINKVRPLVAHGGRLVVVNNALFVSGAAFDTQLATLSADGYLSIEERIPVGDDFVGDPALRSGSPVTDPAPWNHSTKIAVLRVTRKDI